VLWCGGAQYQQPRARKQNALSEARESGDATTGEKSECSKGEFAEGEGSPAASASATCKACRPVQFNVLRSHNSHFQLRPRQLHFTMKKALKSKDLVKDFGPEWSRDLAKPLRADPYLVILEQEAWNDAVDDQDSTEEDEEETGDEEIDYEEEEVHRLRTPDSESTSMKDAHGYLTPPSTPHKHELARRLRTIQLLDAPESVYQELLIGARKEEKAEEIIVLEAENKEMAFGTKVLLFVMMAVLLHGFWTHWNEADERNRCACAEHMGEV
jgi:hypothetical protein